jgi:NAD+ kinase
MKTAAIISKPNKPELKELLPGILEWLTQHGYTTWVDEETAAYGVKDHAIPRAYIGEKKPQFVIVLGGDGTLLSAARAVAEYEIPLLAVNLGSLGFLTEVALPDLYSTLELIEHHECPVEQRSLLRCELVRDDKAYASWTALNDLVVNKSAIARLVGFDMVIDGTGVFSYKADGVIVATPTGSTAYSLAAGGPILMPSVDAFVITPVCPHSLTHRPLVVRDSLQIDIVVQTGDEKAFLSIDGQVGVPVHNGDRVRCSKSPHKVKLFRMKQTFFDVLRAKLKWGER